MSHLPLDARAILHYLNELGYRNISATQLKEFLKDLRKLIKYEERMGVNTHQNDYYEGLFRRTTASYRAKLDKENAEKLQKKTKIFDLHKPSTSKQAGYENRPILYERNHIEISSSSSNNLVNKNKTETQQHHRNDKPKSDKADISISVIKSLIEEKLNQVLRENFSPQIAEKSSSKDKATIKSIVEDVLKEKLSELRQTEREKINTFEPGSLRAMIADIVEEILQDKLSNLAKSDYNKSIINLERDLQQKLSVSNDKTQTAQPQPLVQQHNSSNRSLNSQTLVDELLDFDNGKRQALKSKTKSNKESSNQPSSSIKRLQRSPRKKPEWQDPSNNDNILDKPQRPLRAQSPVPLPSGRSGRSSSVMIPRSAYYRRTKKPKSDPVALYQYYKNEWEHFRMQIPEDNPHHRLRWNIRQDLLDPK